MASVWSGSSEEGTSSLEGGLGGGNEDQLSTCSSSLELEDIQEAILGVSAV